MQFGEKRGLGYFPRILVLGDTGFFGQALKPFLEKAFPKADIVYAQGTKFFDLTQPIHAQKLFSSVANHGSINVVINLAALSGGMFSNMESPASYWYVNSTIIANILEQSAMHKVQKLIMPIGGCSYPDAKEGSGVYVEEDFWNGFPNRNSFGYSLAKRQAVAGAMAYEEQFGLRSHVLIPTNPIGPGDNASDEDAHVPMALIKRFVEAKESGSSTVVVYGDGTPVRDFIFIDDIVKLFPAFIKFGDGVGPMNISTGQGTTIAELAELISKVVGFSGKIEFDKTRASGQAKKVLDNTKLKEFLAENEIEWKITPLEEAIAKTVAWYKDRVWTAM